MVQSMLGLKIVDPYLRIGYQGHAGFTFLGWVFRDNDEAKMEKNKEHTMELGIM